MTVTDISTQKRASDKPIRLAAYCRVSTNSEDQQQSYAAQIKYYTEYIRTNPEYTLVDIYADEGITGTSMKKRDDLNRMLRDCKRGKIDRIIVKSVSRFARNTEELLAAMRMLKELGISIYFEEQGIDSEKLNAEMIVTFPGMAAQQESVSISNNVRWSYRKRMETGEFNCNAPAYGYQMVNGQLAVYEPEAKIIRRVFNLYLQGLGASAIAKLLNEEGAPRRYGFERWYSNTIHYILSNERYMGDALLQKKYTTDTLPFRKMKNRGEREQFYVENANPPIVSRKVFLAAQQMRENRSLGRLRQRRELPLSGMLRCPDCGRAFHRRSTGDRAFWSCSGSTTQETDCPSRSVREKMVYETFMKMVYKLWDNRQSLLEPAITQIRKTLDLRDNQEEIRALDKAIADLSAQSHVVARLHNKGILNAAEYAAQNSELQQMIMERRAERRQKLSDEVGDELMEDLKTLNEILADYTPPGIGFDANLFDQIVESITVLDQTQLQFHLLGGIALTERIDQKGWCKTV